MPVAYLITFQPSGKTVAFSGSRGNYYELENGMQIIMETEPVWCHVCAKIGHGESIKSPAEIDQAMTDLQNPDNRFERAMARVREDFTAITGISLNENAHLKKRMHEMMARREWREHRVSKPRCIECGSIQILPLPVDQEIQNPAGTGTILLSVEGLCSTGFNQWVFTPEGLRKDVPVTYE